jgi:hypothetical protein
MIQRSSVRWGAALSAASLVLTLVAPADASVASKAPGRAGHWLERQLTGGLVHNDQYAFDDYGLTADTALALRALGGHRDTLTQIGDALAQHVDSWTTGADYGTDDVYAGSVAKAVVLARAVRADPTNFGGVDLIDRLDGLVATQAPIKGRIQDHGASDYANVIGQAFAVRALGRGDSATYRSVRNFFLKQQCRAGYFRLNFAAADAASQTCDGGDAASSAPDPDVTSLAVLSLEALPAAERRTRKVRTAIHDAVVWLKGQQRKNGALGGGTSTKRANANSTGLAGWAFAAAGRCGAAVEAATWVRKLQVTDQVAGERGGIAYDRPGFRAAKADGITTETRDQWRRATTQAAPALLNRTVKACRAR